MANQNCRAHIFYITTNRAILLSVFYFNGLKTKRDKLGIRLTLILIYTQQKEVFAHYISSSLIIYCMVFKMLINCIHKLKKL